MGGNNNRSSFKFEFPVPATKTFKPEIGNRKEKIGKRIRKTTSGQLFSNSYFLFSK